MATQQPRITRVFGAVNIGSFRVSAMIMGQAEGGEMIVLGSSHRASEGIKRGYVTDMRAASHAIRTAVEKAEANANTSVQSVWIGCAGAGLSSKISSVEIAIGGRRIEEDDIEHLLYAARDHLHPDGRMVLHAQPAHYTLDGAHGVANPKGLHAEALGVDVHVTLAEGAPVRNLIEAVQTAHLDVEGVVASPLAAAHACLSGEERDLGDPDRFQRHHRCDRFFAGHPAQSGRTAQMRVGIGDRHADRSPRDDRRQRTWRGTRRAAGAGRR